jgi:hypothetical protein
MSQVEPQHTGEMSIKERGGSGTRQQASPDPRTTHSPKAEAQGVCT